MTNITKKLLSIAFVGAVVGLLATTAVFAQDDVVAEEASTVSGTVSAVDVEASTIAVTYPVEGEEATVASTSFKVTEDTAIMAGEEKMELSAIEEGEAVTVEYSVDEDSNNIAKAIWVTESAEEAAPVEPEAAM